jgi:hypothetical protein
MMQIEAARAARALTRVIHGDGEARSASGQLNAKEPGFSPGFSVWCQFVNDVIEGSDKFIHSVKLVVAV